MPIITRLNRRTILKASAGIIAAPAFLRRAYAADVFKIGKVGPVTGPIAGFGEATAWVVDGLKDSMAKLPVPVEIIQKDSQSNPNRAAEVATELIEKDQVKMLLAKGTPDTTNPVADQAELNGVPCITDDAPWQPYFFGRGGDPATGFKWTYHAFWGLEDVIANFLALWDQAGVNKVVGGLFPNDADGNAWGDPKVGFPGPLAAAGYKLIDPGRYQPLNNDFSSQIAAFKDAGVEIVTGARVEQIIVEGGRAAGVRVAGETIAADAVIADIDVATVYERLLPAGSFPERRLRRLTRAEPSCSGFILMLGVQGEEARLAHHNILFSNDYAAEFSDIFSRGVPPDDTTIYIAITSKTDADHAPPGCENWFVLVNAPALGEHFDWATQAADYRERVLAALGRFGFDLRGRFLSERMLTPVDLERMSGARRGALYGLSSNDRFNALRRPHNRAPDIRRLYFAGGTTHPGGGVPMVTLSGKVAARLALEDLAGE